MTLAKELTKIVGSDAVITKKKDLAHFQKDSSAVAGKMPASIVKPRGSEEVQNIVRLANDKEIPLIPCSSAGPRARGDTVPLVENAVVVDLSEMNGIVRIDQRNKVALIEPGVTFKTLQAAAGEKGLRLSMPMAPRPGKSVIGSLLEREPTTIPKYHWDMSDPLCCIEVIFGDGELFRTGAASGPGTLEAQWASGQAQKSPMGPAQADWAKIIQGSQGSLGIVTWASVKLEQKPTQEKAFLVEGAHLNDIVDFAYAIIKPRLADVCLLLNRAELTAILGKGAAHEKLPEWVVLYSLSGYEHFPEKRIDYLEKDIADIASATGVTTHEQLKGIDAAALVSTVTRPSREPYWKCFPSGGFQDIFFLSTLDKTPQFVTEMAAEAEKHGLPKEKLGMYLQPIQQGRNCHVEFSMFYDPKNSEESSLVARLFDSASKKMIDRGGFFSRPYGSWSEMAYAKCPDTVQALKKVKAILDPKGIMNPGKLCFGEMI